MNSEDTSLESLGVKIPPTLSYEDKSLEHLNVQISLKILVPGARVAQLLEPLNLPFQLLLLPEEQHTDQLIFFEKYL